MIGDKREPAHLSIHVILELGGFLSLSRLPSSKKTDDAFVQRQSLLAFIVTPMMPPFTGNGLKLRSVNGIGFALSVLVGSSRLIRNKMQAIGERFYVARVSSAELEDIAVCEGKGLVTEEMYSLNSYSSLRKSETI